MPLMPSSSRGGSSCLPWIFALAVSLFATALVLLGPGKQAALQCVQTCSRQQPGASDIVTSSSSPAIKSTKGDDALNSNNLDDVVSRAKAIAATYTPLETITVFPASFWFVKNVKVGGTTLAGVLRGVCAHYGMACLNPLEGRIGWKKEEEIKEVATAALAVGFEHVTISNHGAYIPSATRYLGKGKPLLFTTLRHPVNRVLSAYFYNLIGAHRSHTGVPEREGEDCIAALQAGKKCKLLEGFEDHYVHGDGIFGRNHIFKYIHGDKTTAKDAFQQYDFVFMTERFDESLVLFMLKYGLSLRDIAYLKMKDRSGTYPREEQMPKDAIEFIKQSNDLDLELWDLANAALNAEKDSLAKAGHDVQGAMAAFAAIQAVVAAECSDYERWYEEHGFNSMLTYWGRDNGVGTTPKGQLYPKGGQTVITLKAKGYRLYWCHSGVIELNGKGKPHGDGKAELVSTDGEWSGNLIDRPSDGLSQWTITNKSTGAKRVIIGAQVPDARAPAPNGSSLTWDRGKAVKSTGPAPKISWVVRSNTTSGTPPYKCKQDIDVKVPFTAIFEMISCY